MIKKFPVIAALLVSACAVGGNRTETDIYTLKTAPMEAQYCRLQKNLQIAEPIAGAGLDTRRIAVMDTDQQMNYYNGARWAAPVSEMMQKVFLEAFEQSKAFKTVSSDMESVPSDYTLLTDIRDYTVTDTKGSGIKIRLVSKLIDSQTREVIATIPIEKTAKPSANKTEAIVETFNKTTSEVASDIVRNTISAMPGCVTKQQPIVGKKNKK